MKEEVFNEICVEMARQDRMFGVQTHTVPVWLMILAEEFGEVSQAANELWFNGGRRDNYREELIQVAAVAVQMVRALDKQIVVEEAND